VTLEQLRAELESGRLRPVYLLAGEEALLRDDALASIRSAVLGDAIADFNFDALEGGQVGPAALLDAVRMLPVMASRRLVVLREPEPARGRSKGLAEALAEVLEELASIGSDGPGSVLVVVAARPDRRSRWVKRIDSEAIVACDPPRGAREIAGFVKQEAARQGIALERGVAERLAERIGPQLLLIRQELGKLALLAGEGARVTCSHVEIGAADVAEEPIWDLTDAIGDGRGADALAVLARLLRAGAPPPVVLGALVSHFRKLLRLAGGGPVAAPPFVRRKLETQSRRYGSRRLLSCLRAIHETDLALKGAAALRPELALERLVLGLSG
jgi:DNA polymerase-3 subunit delta